LGNGICYLLSFLPAQEGGAEKQILQEMDRLAPTAIVGHFQDALWSGKVWLPFKTKNTHKNKQQKILKLGGTSRVCRHKVHAQVFIH
jgi:hypothetical protein